MKKKKMAKQTLIEQLLENQERLVALEMEQLKLLVRAAARPGGGWAKNALAPPAARLPDVGSISDDEAEQAANVVSPKKRGPGRPRKMSDEARQQIGATMKARWAERKKVEELKAAIERMGGKEEAATQ